MNRSKPVSFLMEEVFEQYGYVEVIHQLAKDMSKQGSKYTPIVRRLEQIRMDIGKIEKESMAIALPEQDCESPVNQTRKEKS